MFGSCGYIGDHYYLASFNDCSNGLIFRDSTSVCAANAWNHHVYRYDSGGLTVFRNGVQVSNSEGNGSPVSVGQELNHFGSRPSFGTNGLDGYLDEVMVFDRAITDDEVQTLYNEALNNRPLRWQ